MIEIQVNILIRVATPDDAQPEPTTEQLDSEISAIPAQIMRAGLRLLSGAAPGGHGAPSGRLLLDSLADAFAKPLAEHQVLGIFPRVVGPVLVQGPPS